MSKNNTVDTAQKGQTATKNNIPTGKVKTLADAAKRRKTREEQFRNFRINALRRRCKRMGFDEEKTEELVKKLIEQMDAPKEYSILIMLNSDDGPMMKEALAKANIHYNYHGDTFFSIDGNQNALAKIREIAPASAKIYPYAKKMESVLPKGKERKSEYVAKNTDKSSTAKYRRLAKKADKLRKKQLDGMAHNDRKLHAELQKQRRLTSRRKVKTALKKLHIKLSGCKKKRSSIVVQLPNKKASAGSKTAKKAA